MTIVDLQRQLANRGDALDLAHDDLAPPVLRWRGVPAEHRPRRRVVAAAVVQGDLSGSVLSSMARPSFRRRELSPQ